MFLSVRLAPTDFNQEWLETHGFKLSFAAASLVAADPEGSPPLRSAAASISHIPVLAEIAKKLQRRSTELSKISSLRGSHSRAPLDVRRVILLRFDPPSTGPEKYLPGPVLPRQPTCRKRRYSPQPAFEKRLRPCGQPRSADRTIFCSRRTPGPQRKKNGGRTRLAGLPPPFSRSIFAC